MVRDHHPQRAVRLDDLDAMYGDLVEFLIAQRASCECHHDQQRHQTCVRRQQPRTLCVSHDSIPRCRLQMDVPY